MLFPKLSVFVLSPLLHKSLSQFPRKNKTNRPYIRTTTSNLFFHPLNIGVKTLINLLRSESMFLRSNSRFYYSDGKHSLHKLFLRFSITLIFLDSSICKANRCLSGKAPFKTCCVVYPQSTIEF